MSVKRIVPRKKGQTRRAVGRAKKGAIAKRGDSGLRRRLEDLREQVDIILPEMTAPDRGAGASVACEAALYQKGSD